MMNQILEMLIRRSRQATPVFPYDYEFRAPLDTGLDDLKGRTATVIVDSDQDDTSQTTYEGIDCTYVPYYNRISYPDGDISIGDGARTMSIWVRPTFASYGWNGCICYGDNDYHALSLLGFRDGYTAAASMYYWDNESSAPLRYGWNHLCMTYVGDGGNFIVYLNGEAVSQISGTTVDTVANYICIAGRSATSDNYCETAYFADARIYNYALTDAQVATLYSNGINDTGMGLQIECNNESVTFTGDGSAESYQLQATPSGCTFETQDTLPTGVTLGSDGLLEFDGTVYEQDEYAIINVRVTKDGFVETTASISLTIYAQPAGE